MKTIDNRGIRSLVMTVAVCIGLGFVTHASAQVQEHSYLIDLNAKTSTDHGNVHANAINDAGQVVGYSGDHISGRAFIAGPNGAGMTDFGTLGGDWSSAYGVNDAGQVAGSSTTPGGQDHAFITGPNGVGMTDLGALGGDKSLALGINNAGQVAGWSQMADGGHAFIAGPNGVGMTDLGTLGGTESSANGINDARQVVGYSSMAGHSPNHAFITGANGVGMTDLNSLVSLPDGLVMDNAFAVNNMGQVLVSTVPAALTIPAIPEPESCALMLAGLFLTGVMVRCKQKAGALERVVG